MKRFFMLLLLVLVLPVTLCGLVAFVVAWLAGWPPRRLYVAAAWCLPMVVCLFAAYALGMRGSLLISVIPVVVPLGLLLGGYAWSRRIFAISAGASGRSLAAVPSFDARQWRRQVRTARARLAAPGALPLLHNEAVVTGAVIRAVRHPSVPVAYLGYDRLRSHQVVIGTSGTGKTTLLLRLWAGFMAVGVRRRSHPLLVVIDCKGGASSRKVADRVRRVMRDAGARHTAVWPDDASLSLWSLPPAQLITTLLDLIEHGSGAAAYYRDVMEAIVSSVVNAPDGPPSSSSDFLERLSGLSSSMFSRQQVAEVALRYRALWRRLGPGLDGPGGFDDADAWYCVLEGTAEVAVAEAQARALVDMLAAFVVSSPGRDVLLCVDEFSAVSRRLPIWALYERARSLGLAIQVTSQSWEGLAGSEDERLRIAGTAEGGIWLLRTPRPEPVCALAGSRRLMDTARSLAGSAQWDASGTSRLSLYPVVDPELVRQLDVGQAAYIYRGGVTYVQVKRLVARQAALLPSVVTGGSAPASPASAASAVFTVSALSAPSAASALSAPSVAAAVSAPSAAPAASVAAAVPLPRATHIAPAPVATPDASSVLDEAFGPPPIP